MDSQRPQELGRPQGPDRPGIRAPQAGSSRSAGRKFALRGVPSQKSDCS